jgi:hypothetical protein
MKNIFAWPPSLKERDKRVRRFSYIIFEIKINAAKNNCHDLLWICFNKCQCTN